MSIDVESVRAALDRGETLPADWYWDPVVQRREYERVFARAWQYAGPAEWAEKPGDFFASEAGHVPVVVVRTLEGELNSFVNVCRHRGHVVAEGTGNRKTLQCPYHAWTYGLDGRLRKAPRSEREPAFDFDSFGLLPVAVDTFGPLVFVNPDPEAAPLAETLGELPGLLGSGGLDVGVLRFRERVEWDLAVDWKIAIENYLECYHCPVAHPGFSKVVDVDPDSYRLEAKGTLSSQFGPIRPAALTNGGQAPYRPDGPVEGAQYHFVWPNTTVNLEAGQPNLSVDCTRPTGPERCAGVTDYYFAPDVPEETVRAMMAFAAQVGNEDAALVASVQRGLRSGMVPHGRLLLSSEHLIAHFQGLLLDALA